MTNIKSIRNITIISILSALVVVLAFLPIGNPTGLYITLTIIPIAIGAIIGGPIVGLILGTVFGLVSFLQCLGYSAFGQALFQVNPLLTFLVCVPTRMLAGFIPGLVNKLVSKKSKRIGELLACILVPILNTFFFMLMLILCFYEAPAIQGIVADNNIVNPFMFVIAFVGVNGLVEIICGIIVSFPVAKILGKAKVLE